MSSVEKMTIVGMRSFGPRQNNTIEFYSPLTLIVGANGSGKTTIIECLRYATTGDLPPNSKGGAFVHDPKLVHETEVLAQVKLSFTAVTGAKMLASRSIKCIQKRTKLEMKTMDSSLQVYDPSTKEKSFLSQKCAELDMEIPRMLGVPSAILSNVLFCHQEDSNWPLAEPASLKKKFDDIFEATKYTGALQALKNVIKERKSEVLLERKALETLGVLKEQCERIETNVSNLETRVANRQRLCDEKLSEFQGLENELESLQGQLVELQGALESQKERERDARGLENLKKDIREAIGELFEHDSDEQLNQRLEKHRELEVMAVGDFDTLKAEKTAANLELTEFQGQLEKAYSERGLLVGKLQSCQEATLRLQDTLVLVTDQLKLNNSKSPEEILKLIQNELERKKNALVTFREEFREGNDSIARELNELVSAKTRNTELQKTRQKKIDEFQANKRSIAAELVSITEINDNVISELEEEYKKATRELDLQKENENSIANSKIIGQLESERQILQAKTRNVLSELEKASKLGALLAKREVHQAQLMEKRAFMEKKTVECKGDLINYLARVPALPKLLTEVTGVLEEKQGHVRTVQEAVEANGSRLTAAKAKLSWLTLALDKKEAALYEDQLNSEKELDSNDNNNSSNSSLSSLDSLISHLQQELSKCNDVMATSDISIYEKFKKRAKAEHACPLCERSFPSDHEHSEFLKLLENVISRMPGLLAESANKKQQLSDRLEQVEALRMRIDVLENQEIPPLKQEISQLKNEITGMQDIVDAKQSEIELLKKEEVQLQALRTNALEIDRLFRECAELESEGSRKFNADGDQSVRSVDELRTELNALQSEIQATSDKIAESQKQAGILREALQTLEINVGASRDKLDVAKSALLKKVRLEASLKASEESLDHLTREMRETGIELEERIDPKIERLRGQGEMNNRRLKIRENELISESEIWNKAYYELNSSFKQANSMLESELQSKLDDIVKNVINSLEEKMKSLQRIVQEKSAAMELAQRKSSDLAFVERNILDNIRLRDTCKRLDLLNQEITEAKRLFFNTFGDENLLKERVLNFQTQRSEIAGERSGLLGEIRQLNNQITSLSDELAKNYTNARENYDGQFLKVNIIAAAIEDLEVYAGALDKAIMQFHALKMCEINRLIRDLWMKTYRGADIDTIEIRSEAEGKPTNSATGNRSYNYRVVMIKGNTELDMRGRSSAGQRVLACLIIRLALAEAFGANCGVLALDEPTTNLDHDNISSLASSLCEIVRVRREQSNFQLIVITHDEEFVRQIGRSEYADYYFRVWKDKNQQSIIERQSINHIQH